ncbi:TetR/AcrR family transcriptional regulator [Palleronia sp. LCG004]|uniref:TetR/AcrR family transcriptional regulator n=1 Tax=Palleronia sp. LCG004 TaxID=3079304 RepID=UPI0029422595|nr:TetR/AcrR family transcriptional regulator [Palleronia sp. LCG004]WOI55884.1 TetR/AcrR family transcriptional regulator [Palleronia sp. LCG004]WOI57775.1 TetR/AcrR family transcriptional regulator [Palleronia sp. LCG004]
MTKPPVRRRRNAERTREEILQAALEEFSSMGHSGARVDRIAARAGVSKPMIYDYFGDKDAIYAAALREAYVQIRRGEEQLALDPDDPREAVRELVRFTMDHFRRKPWFIRILNSENLMGGQTVARMHDAAEIQSVLVKRLTRILAQGAEQGVFRPDVDPAEFYVSVASLCYFPISNMHTLRVVFDLPLDDPWIERRAEEASDMLLAWLTIKTD